MGCYQKLLRFNDVWVIMYVNQTISILAVDNMSSATKEFIIKQIKEHKGKIV